MPSTAYVPLVGCSSDPPRTGAYQSRLVERYRSFLNKCDTPQILDIGPVCGSNIQFMLNAYSRLHVCDIVQRVSPQALQPIAPEQIAQCFDYEKGTFDAIHVWDVPDHLEDLALREMVSQCCYLLKPNGLLLMIASTTKNHQPYQHYIVFSDTMPVTLANSTLLKLPYVHRSNRDIEIVMRPLEQYCSFVCMNGIREFLFKKAF
ncbi:MAG: class I SAM-dependent methyltransferase [Chitinispirillaceae bacterium]|nr:class I SAM-dependent methyltransferase [Chitinispirillaceae bacterium]